MAGSILGNNVKRVEDPRFIRGEGRYLDDIDVEGVLHLRSVRSAFAHGILSGVDTEAAFEVPGVVAVYTAADVDLKASPAAARIGRAAYRPLIATDRVRFAGEIVAVVVAETAEAAVDGAERVWPDIDPLPAVTSMAAATGDGAPVLFPELGSNVVKVVAEENDPELFADADVVVRASFRNQRVAPVPLEANSALAVPEDDGRLTLWVGTQNVFGHRGAAARALGVEPDLIRGRVPDMGGGFGAKFYAYPEQILVAEVARRLGRPVKWLETRSDNLQGMTHGRAQDHHVELGAKRDGTLVALRVNLDQDVGAYPSFAAVIPYFTRMMAAGPYRIPRIEFSYRVIVTNTMSTHAYRGAGRPEATALLERAMDLMAGRLEMDPAELRRRNFFASDEFPVTTAVDAVYDSGDYEAALDRALEIAGYEALREEQERRMGSGDRHRLGIGLSTYVEVTAPADSGEWAAAEVNDDGTVTLRVGTSAHGQGHETAFAQIAAQQFQIPYTDVEVIFGDTDRVARGEGTGGSRSLQLGGGAVYEAGETVIAKARAIVAHLLEANAADVVVMDGGRVGVAGVPDSGIAWGELAVIARDPTRLPEAIDPELAADAFFDQGGATFPFGAHVSVVELDTETGDVTVLRHVAVDDAGVILNRWLLDGQVHGGIAQGVGQARFEEMRYDPDGNPLTANLVSYILPMAPNLPLFEVDHTVTPTELNPLGVKGIGEAATIGSTVAVQNAVVDALRPFGVDHLDMPMTPGRVWEAMQRG